MIFIVESINIYLSINLCGMDINKNKKNDLFMTKSIVICTLQTFHTNY